ncbi:MAG TPA: response regulator [Steroidobacteraceae bacterium]|nr:response regulator [Steroidobacteraceae bacterium]
MNKNTEQQVVMVVEPDVLVRMVVADHLRECGYKVIEGVAAADVWAVLQIGDHIDVLLVDLDLAGDVDGFTVATRIRQTYADVDVILTSGISDAADKAQDLCEDGALKKPYQAKDVAARIKTLQARRRVSKNKA